MRRTMRGLGGLAAVLGLASCPGFTGPGVACTDEMVPAIVVEIRDARTDAPLAYNARGVVRDGSYVDSLAPYSSASAAPESMYSRRAADERPGIYAVEVVHAGYESWSVTGVRVRQDVCHVRTAHLRARLVPLP